MIPAVSLESVRRWTTYAFRRWAGDAEPPPGAAPDVDSIRRLGLAPLVYHAQQLEAAPVDPVWSAAAAQYRHAATANLIRLAHGARVRDALEQHGISSVLLKGGAFLVRYCPDTLGVRPMADLDLLVSPGQAAEAERVIRGCGFEAVSAARRADRAAHARAFVSRRAPMPIEIDLHRAVAQWPIATALSAGILTSHDLVDGWRVPTRPHAFCLAALHRARHGFVWSAVDLFELKAMAREIDAGAWREIAEIAAASNLQGAVWAAYRQAVWWLGQDDQDADRLTALARRLGRVRRRVLERIAPPGRALLPDTRWQRPLPRNFVVGPCAITTLPRAVIAGALFLPMRLADEWTTAKASGLGPAARVRRLFDHTRRGVEVADGDAKRGAEPKGVARCSIP